jgi:hypothetical protein
MSGGWSGWIIFAAVMAIVVGAFNVIQGLAALFNDEYYAIVNGDLLVFDFTAWGWLTLIWGILLVLAGFALSSGKEWARWFTIILIVINMIGQVSFLAAFPLWGILIISIEILILYALIARWDEATDRA